MSRLELTVGPDEAGGRLDGVLGARPEVGSRAAAQRVIEAGRVTVNGRRRPKGHRLAPGERVTVELEETPREAPPTDPAAPARHAVVFEDEHLIVVDKPAGVVVHPGHGRHHGTLAQALAGRAAGGPAARAGIVHRLDRDTSGLLVVAKSEPVHARLSDSLRRRAVRREYVTLVEGSPDARTATIDAPVGRDRTDRTLVSTATDRPRSAVTHLGVRELFARTALLDVSLETGRTHQIRAHLAAIGHPVCGDRRYGGAASGRRLGLVRQFLHAVRLGVEHPVTAEALDFSSPLPADLSAALERARREREPA